MSKELFFMTAITFIIQYIVVYTVSITQSDRQRGPCEIVLIDKRQNTQKEQQPADTGKRHEYTTQPRKANGFNGKIRISEKSVCVTNSLRSLRGIERSRQVTRVVSHPICRNDADTLSIA